MALNDETKAVDAEIAALEKRAAELEWLSKPGHAAPFDGDAMQAHGKVLDQLRQLRQKRGQVLAGEIVPDSPKPPPPELYLPAPIYTAKERAAASARHRESIKNLSHDAKKEIADDVFIKDAIADTEEMLWEFVDELERDRPRHFSQGLYNGFLMTMTLIRSSANVAIEDQQRERLALERRVAELEKSRHE